jgi:DNA-binding Xre family transcriptional regulator
MLSCRYNDENAHTGGKWVITLRVKEVAQEKKMSQGQLSRAANIDPKSLRAIYKNPHADIRLSTLDRIAKALEVDPRDLYVWE